MRTADQMRADAAAVTWHIGPAAGCCPTAPCGLVVASTARPDCRVHGYVHTTQSHVDTHAADWCPATRVEGLDVHHAAPRLRTGEEQAAIAARPDALARLARGYDAETVAAGKRIAAWFREAP